MAKLLSSLPVGAKVVDRGTKYNDAPIVWLVGGHNHYVQGQTVLVSEKIITLKAFDAKESSNSDPDRQSSGNNRYAQSNIRQWLNSDKASWYSPQHSADAPPNNANVKDGNNDYDTEAGFLTNFSAGMKRVLVATSLTTAKNTATDGGGSETVTDKVFLLSNTEVGLANENGIAEGKLLAMFSNNASRVAYPTTEAVTKSEYKDTTKLVASKPWRYWLRTPIPMYSYGVNYVGSSGALDAIGARYDDRGVRPAINITASTTVLDSPGADGAYEIITTSISPADGTNLGGVSTPNETLRYTAVTDTTGVTVTEKINGVVVGTKTIVNDTEYTVSATLAQWNAVKYGKYKDTLGNKNVVTLEVSTGEVYTYPFTKTLPTTAKTDDVLIASNDMVNTAMPSHKKKLVDAIGSKATVGGTGSLEDIAKAIESISVESMGGAKFAKGLTPGIQGGISGMPTGLTSYKVKVTGLSFTPDLVIVTQESDKSSDRSPIIYRRKLGMLNSYYQLYSSEEGSTTYTAKIVEVPNGFELPTRSWGTTYRWIAFGFEDF